MRQTIGNIVGGGPESTIAYYRLIVTRHREQMSKQKPTEAWFADTSLQLDR
jgi:aspartate/glutamate racemase